MKSKQLKFEAAIFFLLSLITGHTGQFSFTADFLTPPNHANTPTNVWQYFYDIDMSNRTGIYERLHVFDLSIQHSIYNTGTAAWRSWYDGPPYIGKHLTSDELFPYIGIGEGHIHPDNDGRGIAIGFQAPGNGLYEVTGSVRAAGGGSINWYLDKGNGANVLASGRRLGAGHNQNFHAPRVALATGEVVFLVVDNDGDHLADSVAVEFVVTPATNELALRLSTVTYAGITVLGEPGRSYRVEYLDEFAPASAWTPLTNVTLSGASQFVLDPTRQVSSPESRYYRAVEAP